MKKNIYNIAVLLVLLAMQSCDNTFELTPTGNYSETTAYSSIKNLDMYVKNQYSVFYTYADINVGNNAVMDDGMTDLVKYSWYNVEGGVVNRALYQDNFITVENNFRSIWGTAYTQIRKLNDYFCDINSGLAIGLDAEQLKVRTAEVRFIRAFVYQELTLRYGGVILRIDENKVDGPNERAKARSSEEECWDFILAEYDKAAEDLPESWDKNNVGRLTKGAAYGMKARASLYAKRWENAKQAADKVIGMGIYSLLPGTSYVDYYKIYTSANNSELILPVYFQQGKDLVQHKFNNIFCPPYDFQNGNTVGAAAAPTDEYASSFDINVNGNYEVFTWDKLEQYNSNPFDKREPRFYASILYNDENWRGRNLQLYKGGTDGYMDFSTTGQDNVHKTTTGYLFRKFMSDDPTMNYTSLLSGQYWIEMRLAELYLIRSEANARLGNYAEAYDDLNKIRNRVGLQNKDVKSLWDEYLTDLSKERICELGLEGHRYFDLIRWGKAVEVLNGKRLHGIRIAKSDNGFTYERVECDTQDRLFPERLTIFPIPYTELQTNVLCEQNDLWK